MTVSALFDREKTEMLISQQIRDAGPEVDPIWLAAGRNREDLAKPQILIESTYGDTHPGSRHLMSVAEHVKNTVYASQGFPAVFTVTDICDGVATGHAGMRYSLLSRDLIAGMVEIHARSAGFDGLVTISSCDKAVPGHLMALACLDIPGIHICGGSMLPGPGFITGDTCYEADLRVKEGTMSAEEAFYYRENACPSCGACQYMGTASTMQAMAEALGMALPSSAMMPAGTNYLAHLAGEAGRLVCKLVREDLRPSRIMTRAAFENAIKIHAAIGGSSNAVIHLPAVAGELGIALTLDDFERVPAGIPLLTSVMTAGVWPTQFFWYAGGIPQIMRELRDFLDLDVLTVTGRTIRENLRYLEETGYFRRCEEFLGNYHLKPGDIIKPVGNPVCSESGLAVLRGNLAPDGAVLKHYAMAREMFHFIGRACVFRSEEAAVEAIRSDRIRPGDFMVVICQGKHAAGMPEMARVINTIGNKHGLDKQVALLTDGRFSGGSKGPCIGYALPEAVDGGAIGLVRNGDLIELDVMNRSLNLIGTDGEAKGAEWGNWELSRRQAEEAAPASVKHGGVLKFLREL